MGICYLREIIKPDALYDDGGSVIPGYISVFHKSYHYLMRKLVRRVDRGN